MTDDTRARLSDEQIADMIDWAEGCQRGDNWKLRHEAEILSGFRELQARRAQEPRRETPEPQWPTPEKSAELLAFILASLNAVGSMVSIQEAGDAIVREWNATFAPPSALPSAGEAQASAGVGEVPINDGNDACGRAFACCKIQGHEGQCLPGRLIDEPAAAPVAEPAEFHDPEFGPYLAALLSGPPPVDEPTQEDMAVAEPKPSEAPGESPSLLGLVNGADYWLAPSSSTDQQDIERAKGYLRQAKHLLMQPATARPTPEPQFAGLPIRLDSTMPVTRIGLEGPTECAFIDVAPPADPRPVDELTALDFQNIGSQQTVAQLTRVFDEIDRTGAWAGRFGSEAMSGLADRYQQALRRLQPLAPTQGEPK